MMFFVGLNVYTTLYNTFALALANETAIKLDVTYLIWLLLLLLLLLW